MNSSTVIIAELRSLARPAAVRGMARYGISSRGTLGVSMPRLRSIARREGTNHGLAQALWRSGIHEARILASLVDDPDRVTDMQMERWAAQFDSWDVCDQVCQNLFARSHFARAKALEWTGGKREFIKRAGFVLIARLARTERDAPDTLFRRFLRITEREAVDGRNFVTKGVNWALREIGKRNSTLHGEAMECASRLAQSPFRAARWVGRDALRELRDPRVRERIERKGLHGREV